MQEFYTLVTNIGGAAIANATILGKKVNITDFAVGDGNGSYYTPTADMIKLKNEVWRGRPTNVKIDEKNTNVMTVSTVIPAETGGFTIREMGLFSEDGKLIAVSNCPDVQKVTLNTGVASELELTIQIAVSNVETVEFNIDPTVIIATRKDVEKLEEKLENPEFDDSGEVEEISSFNSFIESVKSKMNIFQFFRNFKAGMKFILHTGMIVDNFTSERSDLPGSAANDKRLYDMIDDVNKNINANTYLLFGGIPIERNSSLNDILSIGNYHCASNDAALTIKDRPNGFDVAFTLKVSSGTGQSSLYLIQELSEFNSANKYTRANIYGDKEHWGPWEKHILNSDLYGMYSIGNDTTFAKVLEGRNNKITPFTFYVPADNPFSFSMGYGIAFNSSMLHNDKMFTLLGFEKTGTKIEVKQFTIT